MALSVVPTGNRVGPQHDPLLLLIMCGTALVTGVLVWLPLVRCVTQGVAYQWVLADGVGGHGVDGDYWLLVLAAPLVLSVLYLGWRGARFPFHVFLLMIYLPLSIAATYTALAKPEPFRFEGATVGVDFSLARIGPLLFGGIALLSIFWVVRDLRAGRFRLLAPWAWTRATRIRWILVFAILPVEVVLFRTGGIQSGRNVLGVGLILWQWFMINRMLAASHWPTRNCASDRDQSPMIMEFRS